MEFDVPGGCYTFLMGDEEQCDRCATKLSGKLGQWCGCDVCVRMVCGCGVCAVCDAVMPVCGVCDYMYMYVWGRVCVYLLGVGHVY